jgi:hypothetical protein
VTSAQPDRQRLAIITMVERIIRFTPHPNPLPSRREGKIMEITFRNW